MGLVLGGHGPLTKMARAIGSGSTNVHAVQKRLSRPLESPHWSMEPVLDEWLASSAQRVGQDSLLVADLTDLAKPYARSLEGLGRVRDASDPDQRSRPGYMLLETYLWVRRWQVFPLRIEPLKTYRGAATSENAEILEHLVRIEQATPGRGTWVLDRGFDRRELLVPMLPRQMAFLVRQRGDRHIRTADGQPMSIQQRAAQIDQRHRPPRWPSQGWTSTETVFLPEAPEHELLWVLFWRQPGCSPRMLLVSPQARRPGRTGAWFVRAFRRRWGVEDAPPGDQTAISSGTILGPQLAEHPSADVPGGGGFLLAQSLGRRPFRIPSECLPEPPLAIAQRGNLPIRLAHHANQPISAPKTENPPPRLLRPWVNPRY